MTVAELIAALQALDPALPVLIPGSGLKSDGFTRPRCVVVRDMRDAGKFGFEAAYPEDAAARFALLCSAEVWP